MRTAAALLMAGLLASCAAQEGTPPARITVPSRSPSPSPSPSPVPLVFSADRAMVHVRALSADIGVRASGTPGEAAAAEHLAGQMAAAGMQVRRQEFVRADGGVSQNVISRLPGADYSQGYIVIGAHYDTVPSSPGGNDNASGSGVLVALAESISRTRAPVELIHFAAEEIHPSSKKHHEGSMAYVKTLTQPSVVKAVVSVDMVGKGPRLFVVQDRKHPSSLQQEITDLAVALGIPVTKRSLGAVSDHTSFTEAGVPGVLLWSGRMPEYHTPRDTFETVDAASVDRAGRLLLGWVKSRTGIGP